VVLTRAFLLDNERKIVRLAQIASTLLALVFLAGCSTAPETSAQSTEPLAATQSPAATSPPPEPTFTPLPDTVRLWASPALPAGLSESANLVSHLGELPVEWVDDPTLAEVRIEANPDRPVARWIYAAVAPFPTVSDQVSLQELRGAWTSSGNEPPIYVSDQVRNEMLPLLGSESEAFVTPEDELQDRVWGAGNAYAIIPFEQLNPRWKVMRLNDSSPLDRDFDPQRYSLATSFGLSGDPETMDLLQPLLDWPETNRDPNKLTTALMTGVSALVRATAWRMDSNGADYPGKLIADVMQQADITHISHESAFSEDCPPPDPVQASLRFCSAPRHLPLFESVGVDLIELSGNHLSDWGAEALLYTLDQYDLLGFETFAGGRDLTEARLPVTIEHNGNRLAFLGCNAAGPAFGWAKDDRPGALSCNDEGLMERVTQLSDEGYQVIFTFQWPESDSPRPLPNQVAAFQSVIDAGASIVNGSQAHRPQSLEFYSDGLIHYGLGNLFFDQMHTPSLRQEFLDRHTFYDGQHISTELITALLEDYAQPRPMTDAERKVLLNEIFAVSGW
jgi:poly-gamma-glutamate synthesis protein (capsule biosynthesis protein)